MFHKPKYGLVYVWLGQHQKWPHHVLSRLVMFPIFASSSAKLHLYRWLFSLLSLCVCDVFVVLPKISKPLMRPCWRQEPHLLCNLSKLWGDFFRFKKTFIKEFWPSQWKTDWKKSMSNFNWLLLLTTFSQTKFPNIVDGWFLHFQIPSPRALH